MWRVTMTSPDGKASKTRAFGRQATAEHTARIWEREGGRAEVKRIKLDVATLIAAGDGRYSVGQSISLVVRGGSALWEYQFRNGGKHASEWLGSAIEPNAVSLTEAREKRAALWLARKSAPATIPDLKDAIVAPPAIVATEPNGLTFGKALLDYLAERTQGWRGGEDGREARQWKASLAGSTLLPLTLAQINEATKRDALMHFPSKQRERVRGRINAVVQFMIDGRTKSKRPEVEHFEAMPYAAVPDFYHLMSLVSGKRARIAKALRWTILTNCRTGDTLGLRWGEINGVQWTIPGARHKSGKEFRIPLTQAMRDLLGDARGADDELVFAKLEQMAMLRLIRKYDAKATVHGFRSSFRDWASEQTTFSREVIEVSMAHRTGDATEQSYARSDLFERRRELMQKWSAFVQLTPRAGGVIEDTELAP